MTNFMHTTKFCPPTTTTPARETSPRSHFPEPAALFSSFVIRKFLRHSCFVIRHFPLLLILLTPTAFAAGQHESAAEKQRKAISVLQSDVPLRDKAIACKQLAIYGDKKAVPVLAPLLANEKLASWARIALEAIPDSSADDTLRAALDNLRGQLLVGVINSIGVRRDAKAVAVLAARLNESDHEVASAAAEALGQIGGSEAAGALTHALAAAPEKVRSAAAYGCILCAEKLLAKGHSAKAARLYDSIRQASVPKQRIVEATRGAILARKTKGIPLLLDQLRSDDKAMVAIALRTARELPGGAVAKALAAELDRATPQRQPQLFLALADRNDAAVPPKVLALAQTGPNEVRKLALGMLDRFPGPLCVAVLLEAAAQARTELAQTAKATLVRLGGKEVDADLVARLRKAEGKTRQVLIELAAQRHIAEALPAVLNSLDDTDSSLRHAALKTVGVLGSDAEAARLVRQLVNTTKATDRDDLEQALLAICGHTGKSCLPHLLPLTKSDDSALRGIALRTVASIGGNDALNVVNDALNDQDESIQNEAVQTLSEWPGNWPEDSAVSKPLWVLATAGKKPSHRVQGLRGYLKYIQETKDLNNDAKLTKLNEARPLITRDEEKQLLISVLSAIPTAGSLEFLVTLANDSAVSEDACLAITNLASQKDLPKDALRKALQTALEKSKRKATRKKAQEALD